MLAPCRAVGGRALSGRLRSAVACGTGLRWQRIARRRIRTGDGSASNDEARTSHQLARQPLRYPLSDLAASTAHPYAVDRMTEFQ
jgi:hypothetical protein